MTEEKPSSPPCMAGEGDPAYGGWMTRDELVAFYGMLLEAERAGVKVAQAFRTDAPDAEAADLMKHVQRDEGRYCALLSGLITDLGATPDHAVGAFYEKAIAVEGFAPRLAFLNKGQGWVVRKLAEALPRIRDDRAHAALTEMLETHRANIATCDALVAARG